MRLKPHAPVLLRPSPDGSLDVQIGLTNSVVLRGLSLEERAFAASLEGGRVVAPAQARRFTRLISLLTDGGAWDKPIAAVTTSVAVHGAGDVGMTIAALLVSFGFDVALHDAAPSVVEPLGTYIPEAAGTCAGAASTTLGARGVTVRVGGGGEDVAVIVCTGAPDPAVVVACVAAEVPHVLVICDGIGVWVSHVMVPGLNACARCRDLQLTRADDAWPFLSLQLGGGALASRRPVAPRLALPAAAVRAAARVAGWLERGAVGTAETIAADGELHAVPLAPLAACGCGAAGPVGDEVAARRARWPRT